MNLIVRAIWDFGKYIHPDIVKVAQQRFLDGHYADSIESAFKGIEGKVKAIILDFGEDELSGSSMMQKTFGRETPLLEISDRTTKSGQDIQNGYTQIFAGAMTAIRNPNAHGNLLPEKSEAIRELMFASLLMYKIDEALHRGKR